MMKVGLTGGIGSGKSTVGQIFRVLGVPVYIADIMAHRIMISDLEVRDQIVALLGEQAYTSEGLPARKYMASRVFNDAGLLHGLNAIMHPAVRADFVEWASDHIAPYVIQEAAVLFESGGDALMDQIILVWAPEQVRIDRVMARDSVSREDVQARIQHQLPDAEKVKRAQFVINNDGIHPLIRQVMEVHAALAHLAGFHNPPK